MSELRFKTQNGDSPQGKPKVFFACHPGDFDLYFPTLSRELFSCSNCAVFWAEEDPAPEDSLEDMNLFVFAVTRRLLTEPNAAMDRYFPFAEDHHIPILPLIQDSDMDELYASRFGDLHYLDRHKITATSISYADQLKRFTDAVLINDETAEKIRKAFDAYIFLSYRKKDRQYAQELMRLIHSDDFFRDVAIWYDEYLVPGESFNDAIMDMLEKSQLFALAVTPNLVNEPNYVVKEEYPKAVASGKNIVAAEMLPTDRGELKKRFESFPGCINPRDSKKLREALKKALGDIARQEKDSDHLFFMGLAYLAGIDVEINQERAVGLITEAAGQKNMQAMHKLSEMYRYGDGVRRNLDESIRWQKEIVAILEAVYEKLPIARKSPQLAEALYDLANLYALTLNDREEEKTLLRMGEVCEQSGMEWSKGWLLGQTRLMGAMYVRNGNISKVREWLGKTLTLCESLMADGIFAVSAIYISAAMELATGEQRAGERGKAEEILKKACGVCDTYADKANLAESKVKLLLRLAEFYTGAEGSIIKDEKEFGTAGSYLDEADELCARLEEAGKDMTGIRDDIISARTALGIENKKRRGRDEIYRSSMGYLHDNPEDTAGNYYQLRDKLKELNKHKGAAVERDEEIARQKEEIRRKEENAASGDPRDRLALAMAIEQLAGIYSECLRIDEASECHEQAIRILNEVKEHFQSPDFTAALAGIFLRYATDLNGADRTEQAVPLIRRSCETSEEILKVRQNKKDYDVAIISYKMLGKAEKDPEAARQAFRRAIRIAEQQAGKDNSRPNRLTLASTLLASGYDEKTAKGTDKEALLEALGILLEILDEYPSDALAREYASSARFALMTCDVSIADIDRLARKKRKGGFMKKLFGRR